MPYRDPAKQNEYSKAWVKRRNQEIDKDPVAREARLEKRRQWRRDHPEYRKEQLRYRSKPEAKLQRQIWRAKKDYGDFAEAVLKLRELERESRTNPLFESIPEIRYEKKRQRKWCGKTKKYVPIKRDT